MTIHKVGRRQYPVKVTVNYEQQSVWSYPVFAVERDEHRRKEFKTFYDFKSVSETACQCEIVFPNHLCCTTAYDFNRSLFRTSSHFDYYYYMEMNTTALFICMLILREFTGN